MSFECSICWGKFSEFDENFLKVSCPYCNDTICSKCAEHCLLEQKVAYYCPNCKKEWNFSFIFNSFSQDFIKNRLIPNYSNICKTIDKQQYIPVYVKNKKILDIIVLFFKNLFEIKDPYSLSRSQARYIINKQTNQSHCISYYNISNNDIIYYYSYYVFILYNILNNNIQYLIDHNYKVYYKAFANLLDKNIPKVLHLKDKILDILTIDIIEQYQNIPRFKILYDINLIISKYIKLNTDFDHVCGKCFNIKCQGYLNVYQTQMRCNVCNKCYCIRCHKEIFPLYYEYRRYYHDVEYFEKVINPHISVLTDKQLEHTCNEDDIKNIQFLTLGTKHCPNCNEVIYKDGGCDHMWCSKCHTMFNWSTLKITSLTTNPHFYNWLRQLGITREEYYNNPVKYNSIVKKDTEKDDNQFNILFLSSKAQEIIERYFEFLVPIIERLIDFLKLLCIPKNIPNTQLLDYIRLLYAYNLISEEDYTLSVSKLYIEKYFIDEYNKIIDNTVYMVSTIFENIPELIHSNNYIEILTNNMANVVKIHNNAVYKYNIIFPYFSIDLINEFTFTIKHYKPSETFNINKILDFKIPITVNLNCYNYSEIEYITDDTNKKYKYTDEILDIDDKKDDDILKYDFEDLDDDTKNGFEEIDVDEK